MSRTIWTEEEVHDQIIDVMKSLNLNRMPSRNEIEKVHCNSKLTNKISKTGGFYAWARRIGLDIKESETLLGSEVECYIKDFMITLGHDVEMTTTKCPYDLYVNRRVKIDVKAGRVVHSGISPYYTFNLEKATPTCDFFVAVTLSGADVPDKIYVIPSSVMAGKTQLSVGIHKSIYDKYIDRWDLIERLDNAYAEIETMEIA